jgi:RNA polymerase sigma-70 factor (ECF subfamily)
MSSGKLAHKTDDELMHLIAEGDSPALSELYKRYSSRLLRYFFRMLWKDENKAQDFLHDLFLKIIHNPGHYTRGRNFSTWIFSVANNMCKNEFRKQAFRKTTANDSHLDNALFLSIVPAVEQNELREDLDNAVLRLDEDEKDLYALRYHAELSLEEIASLLDCPVGTVKSRLFYLKKKLADQLRTDQQKKIKYGIQ